MTENENINEYVNKHWRINESDRFDGNLNVNEHVIIYENEHAHVNAQVHAPVNDTNAWTKPSTYTII